jgi:insertion element IS1 protein InsB
MPEAIPRTDSVPPCPRCSGTHIARNDHGRSGSANFLGRDCDWAICCADFLATYAAVLPAERHAPGGKGDGLTNHVERSFCTLRQRGARFVRKSRSFSECVFNHLGGTSSGTITNHWRRASTAMPALLWGAVAGGAEAACPPDTAASCPGSSSVASAGAKQALRRGEEPARCRSRGDTD